MNAPNAERTECITCPNLTAAKITREHVYGDWMAEYLPEVGGQEMFMATFDRDVERFVTEQWDRPAERIKMKLRGLCTTCNSEWGSTIEDGAKAVMPTLMRGGSRWATNAEAVALGRWAMKVAMVSEMAHPVRALTREQRHEFRRADVIPHGRVIFLAMIGNPESAWRGRSRRSFGGISPEGVALRTLSDRADLDIVTMGFHRVVLFVVGTNVREPISDLSQRFPGAFTRLWPDPYAFIWTPRGVFDDEGLNLLSGDNPGNFFPRQIPEKSVSFPHPPSFG